MTVNIAAPLAELGRTQPDRVAIIETHGIARGTPAERRWTYRELDADSDRVARGLARLGITRGMRTALMVPPCYDLYALTFALFKLGAVSVLIDPGIGVRNLGICLGEAQPEAFIGVTKAHLARLLFGWARDTIKHKVTVGWRLWGGWSLGRVRREGEAGGPMLAPTAADEMAAILFTSGSTGVAKGVVYTHGIFTAQIQLLRSLYHIEPGESDLPTFPLFGLFGPALGMTNIIPEMDATRPAKVDPRAILNAVRRYNITNLFGSPALLRRVSFSNEARGVKLPTLRRVISAGAPVPATVLRQMAALLADGVQVYTPFGATEALPVSSIGSAEILRETAGLTTEGKGVCVGKPVEKGMTVKIVNMTSLPPGVIGEIAVKGLVVTREYYNRPLETQNYKEWEGDEVWHYMGDMGYLDEQGRIWFCGRKAHIVNSFLGPMYTIPCEGVFNAHPAVLRTALVGVPVNAPVQDPVICVELDPEAGRGVDRALLVRQLRKLGKQYPHTSAIDHFLFHPGFPVDVRHNAKIFREKLAVWAAARLGRT